MPLVEKEDIHIWQSQKKDLSYIDFLHCLEKPWDENWQRIILVLLLTGMRIGECIVSS